MKAILLSLPFIKKGENVPGVNVTKLISGQQGLTINRSAESIEITSKDTPGGWKGKIAGMKEWSIENDGLFVPDDESHGLLSAAFENGTPVCVKVIISKLKKGMFGGLATITDYPLEAPFDEALTYSLTLEGLGALRIDLGNYMAYGVKESGTDTFVNPKPDAKWPKQ